MTHPELLINSVPKPKGVPSKHWIRVASVVVFVLVLLAWLFTFEDEPLKAADDVARGLAATLTPVERAKVDQNHQLIEEAFKASGLPSELPLAALTSEGAGAQPFSLSQSAPWSKSANLPVASERDGVMRQASIERGGAPVSSPQLQQQQQDQVLINLKASKLAGPERMDNVRLSREPPVLSSSSALASLPGGPLPSAARTAGLEVNNAVAVAQESEVMNSKIVVVDFDDQRNKNEVTRSSDWDRVGSSSLPSSPISASFPSSPRDSSLKNLAASLRELDQGLRMNQRMDRSTTASSAVPSVEGTPSLDAMMQAFSQDTPQSKTSSPRAQDLEFLKEAAATSRLKPSLKPVRLESVHAILEGTVIPAVLTRDIVSDLPGTLTAQVTQTVYDSITSKTPLICKGAKLIGRYSNDIRTGQSRLLFAFTRLILLNGQSFNLSGFEGSDALGQAGIGGEVDNHFLKIYGASLAIGALSDQVTRQQAVPQGAFASSSATGQIMVQTTREILQRGRDAAPTITVARGSLINVEVRQDLVFHGGSLQTCV